MKITFDVYGSNHDELLMKAGEALETFMGGATKLPDFSIDARPYMSNSVGPVVWIGTVYCDTEMGRVFVSGPS